MKYIKGLNHIKLNNTVVTIGKFDGNHVGHKVLFNEVAAQKEYAMDAVILTFGREIRNVAPEDVDKKRSIMTSLEKQNYEYPEDIDYVIECDFNEVKDMPPEVFVQEILVRKLGVRKVVVGNDFRFGKDRSGDILTLYELGEHFGFELISMEKITYDGAEISSTLIKQKIKEGDMKAVSDMLGEPFSVTGEVVHGKELGRVIGFPTINFLVEDEKILPPNGVYATRSVIDGISHNSITNIGLQPTVGDNLKKTVETHIFEMNQDLYGKNVRVDFYSFIRPEKKFSSLEELKTEISGNKLQVLKLLAEQ